MAREGTKDRKTRRHERYGGFSASSSQDLLVLAARLFEMSRRSASAAIDGNWSAYTYAGLPVLLAALQALVVEYERRAKRTFEDIADINSSAFMDRYSIDGDLKRNLDDLVEVRNEIIHPAHVPTGAPDNWPGYLHRVKEQGLLNTTNDPNCDYALLSQIGSHRLFAWAVIVTRSLYEKVIASEPQKEPQFVGHLATFDGPWFVKLPDELLW